jgi:hypothetical protein
MVEVMVVLAIITILFSLVMVSAIKNRKKASVEATKALILNLESALDDYKQLRGVFPPDGFDSDQYNDEGEKIFGSACLYYHLSKEVQSIKIVGGKRRLKNHEPVMDFKESNLTEEEPDFPGVREIIDGFSTPIHYDNTEDGEYEAQEGEAHLPEVRHHPPDPRDSEEYGVVENVGIQRKGTFDIWSHGADKHLEPKEDHYGETIASWNMTR